MGMLVEEKKSPTKLGANEKSGDLEAEKAAQRSKIGVFQAFAHLFKGSVGAGLFAMGDCFKNGGFIVATILLPIIAVIVVHCERMLINGSIMVVEKTPGATYYDYPETVEKCFEYGPKPLRKFSKLMKTLVDTFISLIQFGACSIYFVFITDNLHQVLVQNGIDINPNMVMLIMLLPALLPSLLTNMKNIAPVSMIASVAIVFGLLSTLIIALTDGPLPSIGDRDLITNGKQMSLFFGTALFAFEGIALVLPVRNSMREPEKFASRFGVLNICIFCVTILFIFTGFVSYLRWGADVKGSITLNLDPESIFCQVVKIIAALGVFFGYPIQFMVLIRIIWGPIENNNECVQKCPITLQVVFRFFMVLLTFGAALAIPKLELFISLIGALSATSLALAFPVLIDFVVKAQTPKGLTTRIYIQNTIIFSVALLGILTGTYQSIVEIIKAFDL